MIKWIRKNLGTSPFMDINRKDVHIVDVRDLVDKKGNSSKIINEKINQAKLEIKKGKKVVICCDYGMSRSNAIAAGVLSAQYEMTMNEATEQVLNKTGETSIKLEILSEVTKALKNTKSVKKKHRKRRILITGSSGFIGRSLVPELCNHFEVFAPTHRDIDLLRDAVGLDLYIKKKEVDTLVHLANPEKYSTNQSMGNTITMLKNVLDVCRENRLFFAYPSGWEIYSGYTSKRKFVDESVSPKPSTTYGYTKWLCESLIHGYSFQFGVKSIIIRSGPVYGPNGNKPKFILNFLEKAMKGKNITTHKYKNDFPRLDLLYIEDLVEAFSKILQCKLQGSINLGTGIGTSTKDIAEKIVKMTDSKSKIQHIQIHDMIGNIMMDSSFAKKKINWKPKVTIQEGLTKLIDTKNHKIKTTKGKKIDGKE